MNKPVAWWTGKYEDEGEDFMFPDTRQAHIEHPQSETHTFFPIPLYTHPAELNDGGEPVKNATYWKRQYNLMSAQCDNLKSGLYHANEQIKHLESHPAELTDEDCIIPIWLAKNFLESTDVPRFKRILEEAILRKAQEK